jgi:catechol 2,3-dioxygenase-like lactoylglutathione lyase family enzyme
MKAHYLGHVVFYVKDLQRSLGFYQDLLGFKEVGRIFNGAAAALTSGRTHHEVLLIQVDDAPAHRVGAVGGCTTLGLRSGTVWTSYAKPSIRGRAHRLAGFSAEPAHPIGDGRRIRSALLRCVATGT